MKLIQLIDDEIVILTTGHQGEPIEAFKKWRSKRISKLHIQKGDTVIDCSIIDLKEMNCLLSKTIDMLYRAGANVIVVKSISCIQVMVVKKN